jgi:hypothetical protein
LNHTKVIFERTSLKGYPNRAMGNNQLLTVPSFIAKSALAQILALAISILGWPILQSIPVTVAAATATAICAAKFVNLPTAWQMINGVIPAATLASLALELPGSIYLVPMIIMALIYAPTLLTGVPYYPTQRQTYALLLAELPTDRPFRFLDIGSGFGDLLIFLSKQRPNGTFVGIELGPLPWLIARIKSALNADRNTMMLCRDMWRFNLSNFDYVYTFLSPAAMDRIWTKVSNEMQPGSSFITNSFPVPAPASEELAIRDERQSRLYIHRL